MIRWMLTGVLIAGVAAGSTYAQRESPNPPSAKAVLSTAMQTARAQNKNIMVHFEASWCSWCKHLDAAMRSPELGKMFDDNYVLVALTVLESDKLKSSENPGAEEMMKELGGEKAGLPFYVFLTKDGTPVANSMAMPKGDNIGYPATAEEIQAFDRLIARTALRLTTEQRARLVDYLKKNAPKL